MSYSLLTSMRFPILFFFWSETALHTCVSIYACLSKSTFKYFSRVQIGEPEQRQLKLKHVWQLASGLLLLEHCSQAIQN